MGNGPWSGRRSGRSLGEKLGSSRARPLILGAMLVLLAAGSALLGSGSRRYAQRATAQFPAAPIPTSSGSSRFFSAIESAHLKPLYSKPEARAILGQLPLIFEPNHGQADRQVKFLARGAGYSLFLDSTSAVLAHADGGGA